ncbi:hypothetical protein PIROE2DRAFT_20411, partial [Piromyces sp. E2]
MIEKRHIFNATVVNDAEFEAYKTRGFITEEGHFFEKLFYKFAFILFIAFFGSCLYLFYKYRKSYIIRQRGFTLTFIGGIVTFLNTFFSFFPQMMKVPCALSAYNANILNVLVNMIFFCRSLRVFLSYRYNIFKVSAIKNRKLLNHKLDSKKPMSEPSSYLKKVMKRINYVLAAVIIIPALISTIATIIIHIKMKDHCSFTERGDAMLSLKKNEGRPLFIVVQIFGGLYTFLSFVMSILLTFVKDANAFGIKFECISTCILIFIANVINVILQINASIDYDVNTNNHRRMYLDLFESTKGGKMLFTVVSLYMLFASITLPLLHYYKSRKNNRKFNEA